MLAAARSKLGATVDRLRLEPDEVIVAALRLAYEQATKLGMDRRMLHAVLDDVIESNGQGEADKSEVPR